MRLGEGKKTTKSTLRKRNADAVSRVEILCRFTGKSSQNKKKSNGEEITDGLGGSFLIFFFKKICSDLID